MNQPTVDLSVQYVTDLSVEYPDLSVGIVRSTENLAGGQVVVVMDTDTTDALARVMIRAAESTRSLLDRDLWVRAAIDMFRAAALASLPAPITAQVGVLVDLPVSAADLDARDQANVMPPAFNAPPTAVAGYVDTFGRPATVYTPPEDLQPCGTCNNGTSRETVGMICRTCGTDYGAVTA